MAPTLVLRDGRVALVAGSPGGSRIITITAQTILNMLDFGMEPQEAVDAPRIHHQWLPDTVYAEPFALSADTQALLRGMGHTMVEQTPWGAQELIAVRAAAPAAPGAASSGNDASRTERMRPGLLYGANDNRRPAGRGGGGVGRAGPIGTNSSRRTRVAGPGMQPSLSPVRPPGPPPGTRCRAGRTPPASRSGPPPRRRGPGRR